MKKYLVLAVCSTIQTEKKAFSKNELPVSSGSQFAWLASAGHPGTQKEKDNLFVNGDYRIGGIKSASSGILLDTPSLFTPPGVIYSIK